MSSSPKETLNPDTYPCEVEPQAIFSNRKLASALCLGACMNYVARYVQQSKMSRSTFQESK